MRVYLHNLYRKLGVANKTEAVVWYLQRTGISVPREGVSEPVAVASRRAGHDLFGEMPLDESLYAALGVMSAFVVSSAAFGKWALATVVRADPGRMAAEPGPYALERASPGISRARCTTRTTASRCGWRRRPMRSSGGVARHRGYSDAARHFAARHRPPPLTDIFRRGLTLLRTLSKLSRVRRRRSGASPGGRRLGPAAPPARRCSSTCTAPQGGERARASPTLWAEAEPPQDPMRWGIAHGSRGPRPARSRRKAVARDGRRARFRAIRRSRRRRQPTRAPAHQLTDF